jgi:pimeloyl-ACP methyl ester carboxylesterase
MFLVLAIVVVLSQRTVGTPRIDGENAISELREVEFNGRKQWISIRGEDQAAPILLFLAGGPGGTQLVAVRHELHELEAHFVVVGWDQPGSGKSYGSGKNMTHDDYLADGIELTDYLIDAFGKDKIYLMGESWGSYLGVRLAEKAPEKYTGLMTTGQMVNFLETERLDYSKAIELTFRSGNFKMMNKLIANGKPPYFGKDITFKIAPYLGVLNDEMARNPNIHNSGYNTIRDILSPEYGILDKINFFRGIVYTFNDVYQQLYELDLCETTPALDVPVHMLIGRHDLNAPTQLAEEYFELLEAPHKSWVWFEHSGHNPWINETDAFVREVLFFKSLFTGTR